MPMSEVEHNPDHYEDRLYDEDVVCLEVYGTEFVAVVWKDPDRGTIANLRFGSGRHHTAINPEFSRLLDRDSIHGVNVVSMDNARRPQ